MKNIKSDEYQDILDELMKAVDKIDNFNSNCFNATQEDDDFTNNLCVLVRDYYFDRIRKELKND